MENKKASTIKAGRSCFVPDGKGRKMGGRKEENKADCKENRGVNRKLNDVRNKEIGFIFQNYQLIPTYNILQNIIMPLVVRGMGSKEAEEKCMDTIRLLGIDHRLRHKPSELSGGQKQRVSIARALVGEPAILLADEPTGALDRSSGQEVLKLFRKLNSMGHTIVMITHDLNVAKSAGRIVNIIDGELSEADG